MDNSTKIESWWKIAESAHSQFIKRAKKAVDFVLPNRQWTASDIAILDSQKKPHLTINKIFPIIYFMSGYQRQNKFDIVVSEKKATASLEAKILSACIKAIYDDDDAQYEVSDWFLQGIIKGVSWLGGYIDYSQDVVNGDLRLESLNPYDIYPDPNSRKYGMQDMEFLFKKVWMTVDEVRQAFPDKVDSINATELTSDDDIIHSEGSDYRDVADRTLLNKHTEKIRVKECWYLTENPVTYLYDESTGEILEFPGTDEQIQQIRLIRPQVKVIKRLKKVLHLATTIGGTILQDIENPIGEVNRIPFVPFYAYRIDDDVFGMVDQLIDIQKEINKRRSQALHIVNTMTNNLWLLPESAGLTEEEFAEKASRVGGVIKYKGTSTPLNIGPTGAQGAQITAYSAEAAQMDLKEISGVNADLMGYRETRQEPGIVLQLRQQQGAVVIEPVMDNFKYSNRILGSLLIDFIQKSGLYSPNELVQITDEQGTQMETAVSQILSKEAQLKKYNVVISLQRSTPTLRMADFLKLTELVKMGIPIPPDVLIEASDVPGKEKILQRIQEQQQATAGNIAP